VIAIYRQKGGLNMKKLMSLLLSMLLVSLMVLPVLAATDVNAFEKSILDKLEEGVTVGDAKYGLEADVLALGETFFMRDEIDFTEADAAVILAAIDDIFAIIVAAEATTWAELTPDNKLAIVALAEAAVAAVASADLTYTYDFATHTARILGPGSVVLASATVDETVIKKTGFDLSSVLGLTGLISLITVGGFFVIKREENLTAA
jgi:hypothetical protein